MSDSTEHNDFNSRRYRLERARNFISSDTYEVLLNLLNSRNYSQFDQVINSYDISSSSREYFSNIPGPHGNVVRYPEVESSYSLIKDLERKVAESVATSDKLYEQIAKLELELRSTLDSKEKISLQLKNQHNKNRDLFEQNQELLSKFQQKKIDEKVPEYVQGVKEKLQQDDKDFTEMSYNWAIAGVIFALAAIIAAFMTFFFKIEIKDTTLTELLYYYTRGLLGVALLSWLSYFCLNNSKKYTHEAIIRKDRQHALMFGEVFLQIYGSTATKQDAIDVFKDWNMSANSAFSDKTQQPPSLFNILGSVLDKKPAANDDK
ncbi:MULTISPECIES: hypothetical protein [Enterobacter]|uniref:hypothetical protein n=1 Tax=Enterobacter TaxID=547 RepID=UPI0008C1320D|nr:MULTISPECIES: hypothetical protein [Enterobacter]MCK7339434.1 hypothetical protein [Enterobacter cloacae]SEO70041.1 hypothetical protein SAMN03159286_1673 [Enterobacter sp. NFIX58]